MKTFFFIIASFFFVSLASADPACEKALAQATKTCKADHNCKVQYMTVSGFDVVYTGSTINCRGSKSQTGATSDESYFPTRDRDDDSKKKKKTIKIED